MYCEVWGWFYKPPLMSRQCLLQIGHKFVNYHNIYFGRVMQSFSQIASSLFVTFYIFCFENIFF